MVVCLRYPQSSLSGFYSLGARRGLRGQGSHEDGKPRGRDIGLTALGRRIMHSMTPGSSRGPEYQSSEMRPECARTTRKPDFRGAWSGHRHFRVDGSRALWSLALALDVGRLVYEHQQLSNALDAAALAGATSLPETPPPPGMQRSRSPGPTTPQRTRQSPLVCGGFHRRRPDSAQRPGPQRLQPRNNRRRQVQRDYLRDPLCPGNWPLLQHDYRDR